jgi:hypothetical protein
MLHINFEFGSGRRCLRIDDDGAASVATNVNHVWTDYRPISQEIAMRFLAHKKCREAWRSNVAWEAWEAAGGGPQGSDAYRAVMGD